jgi:hypothetical protein
MILPRAGNGAGPVSRNAYRDKRVGLKESPDAYVGRKPAVNNNQNKNNYNKKPLDGSDTAARSYEPGGFTEPPTGRR